MGRELKNYSSEIPLRLNDDLLLAAENWVGQCFTPFQQKQIEHGLNSVVRMTGLRVKGFPIPGDFIQTNLGHTKNIIKDAKDIHTTKKEISKYINLSDVQIFGYGHDIPEVLHKVGDVQPTDRTRRDWARKRLEHIAAKNYLIPLIKNPEARADALRRYKEYEIADPNNLEVQMAKYLDQKDGTVAYSHIIFNRFQVETTDVLNAMRLHLYETLPKMISPAINLLVGLPTREARSEMRDILVNDLRVLDKFAPSGIAGPYIERFTGQ